MTDKPEALFFGEELARAWQTTAQRRLHELEKQRNELLEALRGYVNDFSSEDGMYDVKHYVKVFGEVIARAEGKQ